MTETVKSPDSGIDATIEAMDPATMMQILSNPHKLLAEIEAALIQHVKQAFPEKYLGRHGDGICMSFEIEGMIAASELPPGFTHRGYFNDNTLVHVSTQPQARSQEAEENPPSPQHQGDSFQVPQLTSRSVASQVVVTTSN